MCMCVCDSIFSFFLFFNAHFFPCSIAKTLGALMVTEGIFDLMPGLRVTSHVISDKEAVEACSRFAGKF